MPKLAKSTKSSGPKRPSKSTSVKKKVGKATAKKAAKKTVRKKKISKAVVKKTSRVAPAKKVSKKAKVKKSTPKRIPKKSSNKCYFTSACTNYFGLPDNCSQLQILRNFRDVHLMKTENGKYLIALYYKVAPKIVDKIEQSKNKNVIYKHIFNHINIVCHLISSNKFEAAITEYSKMVNFLIKKYK